MYGKYLNASDAMRILELAAVETLHHAAKLTGVNVRTVTRVLQNPEWYLRSNNVTQYSTPIYCDMTIMRAGT